MTPDTFAVHAQSPDGREGYVLLLFRPDAEGRVAWREWRSDAWMEPGRDGSSPLDEVEARVHRWAREGWKLSESAHLVSGWLRRP